ncbi:hypothetical protein [uncultured Nostoc sp.]|uniref:hypothetical protein n=1 Tax=uncultured Nostoc sp. TaxID=340711 RepID=UPI0035CA0440
MVVTLQLRQIDVQPGQCLTLREISWAEFETSSIFGNLPVIEGILQFLQFSLTEGSSTARRAFKQWARQALAQ